MEIVNHLLKGENVIQKPSPNRGAKFKKSERDTIIMHYTAGANALSSVQTLCNPNVQASTHIVIARDGTVYQLLPFDTVAWHAGRSQYGDRIGFNKYSIGIELDNAGLLSKTEDGYKTWFGKNIEPSKVVLATHRNKNKAEYWHTFTQQQILVAEEICNLLIAEYALKSILGHEEISPGRKQDPGPAFPLDKFRDKLLNANRKEDAEEAETLLLKVAANGLNIRKGPGVNNATVTEALKKDTPLELIEKKGKWMKVKLEVEGWVHADYVEPRNP